MNRSCCKEAWSGLVDNKHKSLQQLHPPLGYLFYRLPLSEATGLSTLMARPCSLDHKPRFRGEGGVGDEHNVLLLAVGVGGNMEEGLRFLNLYC